MNYSIQIKSADIVTVQEDNSQLISVLCDITNEASEVVSSLRHGFPMGTTPEDINVELIAVLATYISDLANTERNAANDAVVEAAQATIAEIVGVKITSLPDEEKGEDNN